MDEDVDYTFRAMGSDVRLLIGRRLAARAPRRRSMPPTASATFVLAFAHRLSRFVPDSELSALNRDPRAAVPASDAAARGRAGRPVGGRAHRRAGRSDARRRRSSGPDMAHSLTARRPPRCARRWRGAPPRRPARPDPARALAADRRGRRRGTIRGRQG